MKNVFYAIAVILICQNVFAQPGASSVNERSPASQGVTQISTINIDPVLKLFPDYTRGDREFDGNGPQVSCKVTIRISTDQRHLIGYIQYKFAETKDDWTTGEGVFARSLFEAPAGKKIMRINSTDNSEFSYLDNDHTPDTLMGTSSGLVKLFEANGDTNGDDIGNNTSDDSA